MAENEAASDPAMPEDPVTGIGAMAAMHHEMYVAYIDAGFSEAQAMMVILAFIAKPS